MAYTYMDSYISFLTDLKEKSLESQTKAEVNQDHKTTSDSFDVMVEDRQNEIIVQSLQVSP